MSKYHRCPEYVCDLPNTPEGLARFEELKKEYKLKGKRIRARGRGPRKQIYTLTGRRFDRFPSHSNDLNMNSPEAPYVTFWAIYKR